MTLHEEYQVLLNDFCLKHKEDILRLPKFEDNGDCFDYTPSYSQRVDPNFDKSTFPENNPLIQDFVQQVYALIWGEDDLIKIRLNGHFNQYDGKTLKEINQMKEDFYPHLFSAKYIKNALNNQLVYDLVSITIFDPTNGFPQLTNSRMPNIIDPLLNLWESEHCPFCHKYMSFEYHHAEKIFTSRSIKVDESVCMHTLFNGNNIYSFTMNVPSKKIVFMNDIRNAFNFDRKDKYIVSLNSSLGKKRECETYAENNVGYFFVSNTSPYIYQNKEQIVIDPFNVKFKRDEEIGEPVIPNDYINRGSICTDLWAVCMADYEYFLKKCKEEKVNPDDFDIIVVDIPNNKVDVDYNFENYLIEIKY